MKRYLVEKYGNLLYTNAAVKGHEIIITAKFLIDTGSNFTILPWESLMKIGCDPSTASEKIKIIAANGYFLAPRVNIEWIHSFGKKYYEFPVIANSLPEGMYADGILGMDFLKRAKARIHVSEGQIIIH